MADSKKGGGSRKIGRNKVKCAQYKALHTREKNKLPRILQSCGLAYAEAWAKEHGVVGYLAKIQQAR